MTTNTSIVTTVLGLLDRQDWPAAMELVAPTARIRAGGHQLDRDGWRAFGTAFYVAFPDGRHVVHRTIDGGDHVTVIASFAGTHNGELMGVPPTGRSVSSDVILVYRLSEGRIVEHFGQFDSAGLMQQLTGPGRDLAGLVNEWYRRIDTKNAASALELATPDVAFHMGGHTLDRDGYVGMNTMFFSAFPDGRHVNDEVLVCGPNRAIAKGRFFGTHTGAPLHGVAPAGKKVELGYLSLVTFTAEGKVRTIDAQLDAAGLMQQLA
jgi:predicted ester cyclase